MQQYHKLEHLFKDELKNFNPKLSYSEIDFLDKVILKNNFYKFNPYHFNLFYAMAIVSGFLLTMTLAGHYLYSQTRLNKPMSTANIALVQPSKQMKSLSPNDKNITIIKPSETKKNIAIKTLKKEPKRHQFGKPHTNVSLANNNLSHDSSLTTNTLPYVFDSHMKSNRKLVYITQKDTIFQIDTVRTLKKNKWFSKNR
jgi:hypothetical protein